MINPKNQFIESTRELINTKKNSETYDLLGLKITTDPEVFDPTVFFSSQWFGENVSLLVKGEKVLIEIGCGTGIVSLKIAKENPNLIVYSTDINPGAKETTIKNAELNDLSDRIRVYSGDVFDGLPKEILGDSIFWAMPFGFLNPDEEMDGRDWQVFDPGYRAIRKFFTEAKDHLAENGRLLVGFSEDIGHLDLLKEIADENNFSLNLLIRTKGEEKDTVSMEIWEARLE